METAFAPRLLLLLLTVMLLLHLQQKV